jgi:hypothetical protein
MKKISSTSTNNLPKEKRRIFGKRIEDKNTIYNGKYEEVNENTNKNASRDYKTQEKSMFGSWKEGWSDVKKFYSKAIPMGLLAFAILGGASLVWKCTDSYNKNKTSSPTAVVSQYTPKPTQNSNSENNLEYTVTATPTCPPCPTNSATSSLESKLTSTNKPTNPPTKITTTNPTYNPPSKPTATPIPTANPTSTTQDNTKVIFYDSSNYQDRLFGTDVKMGNTHVKNLQYVEIPSKNETKDFSGISSIKVNGNYRVTLYSEPNYQGKTLAITQSTSLPEEWNNKVSSLDVFSIPTKSQ